jgi:hypothetical protein
MRRPLAARATPPLLVATFALAASLAMGAQASWTPAAARPAAPDVAMAQVDGVTGAGPAVVATGPSPVSAGALGPQSSARRRADAPSSGALDPAPTSTTAVPATSSTAPVWWSRYHGANHVWMPTLGLSKAVYSYACSRTTYPANLVYRWGCGGHDNVYLFGHNYGVFYPLFDAWRDGRLRTGLPVVYADGQGRTRLYRVVSWRVVAPSDGAWAIASQSSPSMTLQTCSDRAGTHRLLVRLVAVAR